MSFSPDWLTTQYRYREKAGSSSSQASQTPSLIFSMGFTESSQLLNSPTTETLCALGAQTRHTMQGLPSFSVLCIPMYS